MRVKWRFDMEQNYEYEKERDVRQLTTSIVNTMIVADIIVDQVEVLDVIDQVYKRLNDLGKD